MTRYLIADTIFDYKAAHDLIQAEGVEDGRLSFPTILAVKDSELVGVLGTDMTQNRIVASPLVLKSGAKRPFTVIRLVEKYEEVLVSCGVASYMFSVEAGNTQWIDKIEKIFNMTPVETDDEFSWYVRTLPNGRTQRQGT